MGKSNWRKIKKRD